MKLYGISGLGADQRVYQYLSLKNPLIVIEWIDPKVNESIESYSKRLSRIINVEEEFGIIGVSFGGLVAVEISKLLKPKITILISSVETKFELRSIYRIIGKTHIIKVIPENLFDPPRRIANYIFGARNKELLNQILNDTDVRFAKWALNELVSWKNTGRLSNYTLKIEGAKDKLIPPTNSENSKVIKNGGHFMVVDKADEISRIINNELK